MLAVLLGLAFAVGLGSVFRFSRPSVWVSETPGRAHSDVSRLLQPPGSWEARGPTPGGSRVGMILEGWGSSAKGRETFWHLAFPLSAGGGRCLGCLCTKHSGVSGEPQEWRFVLLDSVLGEEAPWGAGLQAEFPSWVVTQPRSEAGNLRLRCRRNMT